MLWSDWVACLMGVPAGCGWLEARTRVETESCAGLTSSWFRCHGGSRMLRSNGRVEPFLRCQFQDRAGLLPASTDRIQTDPRRCDLRSTYVERVKTCCRIESILGSRRPFQYRMRYTIYYVTNKEYSVNMKALIIQELIYGSSGITLGSVYNVLVFI